MISDWPDTIHLRLYSAGTRQPLGATLVLLTIPTTAKNDIPLAPRITNDAGELTLHRAELAEEIDEIVAGSPMDYSPGVSKHLRVTVEAEQALQERVERLRQFFPEAASRLALLVAQARPWRGSTVRETLDVSREMELHLE